MQPYCPLLSSACGSSFPLAPRQSWLLFSEQITMMQFFSWHRIAEWLRLEGTSEGIWSNPLLKQGCLELVSQHHVWMTFEKLQGERLHKFSGQLAPVLSHPHRKLSVWKKPPVFHFVLTASGSVTGHHWEEPSSIFCAPSLQVSVYLDEIPLSRLFSRLNSPSSRSLSLKGGAPAPLHLHGSLLDYLQYVCVSSVMENPELDIEPQLFHQCWAEGKDHLPPIAGNIPPHAAGILGACFAVRGHFMNIHGCNKKWERKQVP